MTQTTLDLPPALEGLRTPHTACWGIDVGTRRIAFGVAPANHARSLKLDKAEGFERLACARVAIAQFVTELAAEHPPLCVFVEMPTGKFVKPSLLHMVGVVGEAVYSTLGLLYPYPVQVYSIGVGSWKKSALGHGNAKKAEVMEWALERVDRPLNQDEADALAIAHAGHVQVF